MVGVIVGERKGDGLDVTLALLLASTLIEGVVVAVADMVGDTVTLTVGVKDALVLIDGLTEDF